MVHLLKKEVNKTQNESITTNDETCKYRQLLVETLHSICLKYPDVLFSDQLVSTLFELLSADDEVTAQMIITFSREFIMKNPQHKPMIMSRILYAFSCVTNVKVHRGLIWMLGEFCEESSQIQEAMSVIRSCLGELPIVESELKKIENGAEKDEQVEKTGNAAPNKLVTADGSYATQSAYSVVSKTNEKANIPSLRSYLLNGDYFIGTALGNSLVKLAYKFRESKRNAGSSGGKMVNSFVAECMLISTSILHLGKSKLNLNGVTHIINEDDYERISLCVMVLSHITNESNNNDLDPLMKFIFLNEMRNSLDSMLSSSRQETEDTKEKRKGKSVLVESDDHLNFSQLLSKTQEMFENQFELSLSQAIAGNVGATATSTTYGKVSTITELLSASKLSKVTQLTGFSDPVYSECYVNVNQYDICLDVLIVNQTNDVLQNCTLELSTLGDLKLVEKPQPIVLAPHDFANIKATVKVASTENGIIFGNIGN